jgi:hypothetical protein
MTAGVLVAGSAPASAQKAEHVSITSATTAVRTPILRKPRFTCHGENGAILVVKLRNRARTELVFEARVSRGEYQEALPVTLPPRGVGSVEFHGITANGRYLVEVLSHLGEYVAQTRVKVRC